MISYNSMKNFFYINTLILSISLFEFNTINYITNQYIQFFLILFIFLSRNYAMVQFINYSLKHKESINPSFSKIEDYKEDYPNDFNIHLLSSTTVEAITYTLIKNAFYNNATIAISYNDILLFIPKSFIFELIFDFFHYWTHRILHTNKFLYTYIHKKHHKFNYPIPILTFYHNPLDLIITNSIPQMFTLIIFPHISFFQFNIILTYKSLIEISGHSSKKLYPSGSFSQFIWLPKLLNISLYTEDHTLHHSHNIYNFSKRFSIWDKLFETYKPPKSLKI